MTTAPEERPAAASPRSLSGLLPFLRPYRWRIALALLALVMAAVSTLVFPIALKSLIDRGVIAADPGARVMALREHFLALFAVGAALGLFSALRFYMVTWLGERVTADLRNAVYAHVVKQSPEFFETTASGEVLSRLTTDTTLVQTVVGSSLSMGLRNAVMGIGAMIMLIVTNPYVMTQVLGILVLVVLPSLYFGRRVRKLSRASQDRVADSSAIAAEVLNAVPVVQSYVQEQREASRFAQATEAAFDTARRRPGALVPGGVHDQRHLRRAAVGPVPGHPGRDGRAHHRRPPGTDGGLRDPAGLQRRGAVRGLWRPAARRRRHRTADGAAVRALAGARRAGAAAAAAGARRLVGGADRRHLPLPLAPGHRGAAACEPARGTGRDGGAGGPQRRRQEHRAATAAALLRRAGRQHPHRRRAGAADRAGRAALARGHRAAGVDDLLDQRDGEHPLRRPEATDAEVIAAAQAAFAHDFITVLPQGYDTFLGERGVRLSGGQRQRISIARALLKNPPLLLLDEATSALDAESERMVQAALEAAFEHRTTIVIAHRLATVLKADRIVVLDQGRIVDIGTHDELVARGGLYARLASMQFGLEPQAGPEAAQALSA